MLPSTPLLKWLFLPHHTTLIPLPHMQNRKKEYLDCFISYFDGEQTGESIHKNKIHTVKIATLSCLWELREDHTKQWNFVIFFLFLLLSSSYHKTFQTETLKNSSLHSFLFPISCCCKSNIYHNTPHSFRTVTCMKMHSAITGEHCLTLQKAPKEPEKTKLLSRAAGMIPFLGKLWKYSFLAQGQLETCLEAFSQKKYSGGKIQDCSHANKKIIFPPTISIKIL